MVEKRYEFLEMLHTRLQPRGYVEIGVQTGGSLRLARCHAVGIDPGPVISYPLGVHHIVMQTTSDEFFTRRDVDSELPRRIDLAFIDGMHLAEYALRDFIHIERHSHSNTVIVFDDVLPYSAAIATRVQPPGDWTGDVWKVIEVLRERRPDLRLTLVDTFPTGTLVITNVNPSNRLLQDLYDDIEPTLTYELTPPNWVLNRHGAIAPADAIEWIMQREE